jgi:hypothetical protein
MTRARELAEIASAYDAGGLGFRNRIINGDMRIDQRNAGASVALSAGNIYPVDRFNVTLTSSTGSTGQRSTLAPSGFNNSLLITIGTGASAGTNTNVLYHAIEGFNIADLGWGVAGAQSVTISFWVRSSLTGTFAAALRNSAVNRCYVLPFTISAANTWELKTATVPGDTSGTWLTDNGAGIYFSFDLGEGSTRSTSTTNSWLATNTPGLTGGVKLCATSGATFYITGVQLEAGSVASPFERRDYGRELMMCQRYYEIGNSYHLFSGYVESGNIYYNPVRFAVTKRAGPVVTPTYVAASRFAAAAPFAQAVTADGFYASANSTLTGTGYFQYTWVASAEL